MTGSDKLDSLEAQLPRQRDYDRPPLHLWHPELCGDIPIRIDSEGTWFHDGGEIKRQSLVRLFASILRREDDQQYYLVTPAEKWRIEVELHPLMAVDVSRVEGNGAPALSVELNTGKQVMLGDDYPLFLEPAVGGIACVKLWHGLTALFTRAAWLRLVDMAETDESGTWIESGGVRFSLMADGTEAP